MDIVISVFKIRLAVDRDKPMTLELIRTWKNKMVLREGFKKKEKK